MIKTITFPNSRNEKIIGELKEKKTSDTLLLVGHGYKSSKNHPATATITDMLCDMGHPTFSFNFSKSASGFSLAQQVADITDMTVYFKNYKRFVILAPSLGALSGTLAAINSSKISGLVTINGFFGSGQIGLKVLKAYLLFKLIAFFPSKYRDAWQFFKKNYQPEKITCDVLVIHAKHDNQVFISQSKDFFKKVSGRKTFHVLEKGDHHLTKESYRQEVAETIDSWLKKKDS